VEVTAGLEAALASRVLPERGWFTEDVPRLGALELDEGWGGEDSEWLRFA